MTVVAATKIGPYEIVEKLGAGGMGTVYKAYQASLHRFVALKTLPTQYASDPGWRERFVSEALAVGKLRHPNIAAAFDFAEHEGQPYLVSEFVDGGTLQEQLGGRLPLSYVVTILTPLAAALDYAHSRGIVHRDVKPTNILIARDGTPVLTDFGLAKMVGGAGLTQTGGLVGSPEYVSPEGVRGEETGPAADQYALALVAYGMLTGRHPYAGETPVALLFAHINKAAPPPHDIGVAVPAATEAALMRGLAKTPQERFPSASAFVKALGGEPAAAAATAAVAPAPTAVVAPAKLAAAVAPARRADRPALRWLAGGGLVALLLAALAALAVAGQALVAGTRSDATSTATPAATSATAVPTALATAAPSPDATAAPTSAPTAAATTAPSAAPSATPAPRPTQVPQTPAPTAAPPVGAATLVAAPAPAARNPGQQGTCSVVYENAGSDPWVKGTPVEVDLALSPATATRPRTWTTVGPGGVVAVQDAGVVGPQGEAMFSFSYTVGADTPTGTYAFVVRPVLSGRAIGPDATCQLNVTAVAPTPTPSPDRPEPSEPPPDGGM